MNDRPSVRLSELIPEGLVLREPDPEPLPPIQFEIDPMTAYYIILQEAIAKKIGDHMAGFIPRDLLSKALALLSTKIP